MEFWGVEVKSGQPLDFKLEEGKLLHLSQACLGLKKGNASESVYLHINIEGKKLVLGTLHTERLPQQLYDLVFDKEFQLSHNWKNGSVYFYGYKADQPDDNNEYHPNDSDISESDEEDDIPLPVANGKQAVKIDEKPGPVKADAASAKASGSGKQKVKIVESVKDVKHDENDSDDSDDSDDALSDDSDSEEEKEDSSDDDELDDEDDEDEETPKKQQSGKKRPSDSAIKTPGTGKKPMLATPQKTGGKKGEVHVDTPHPSKKTSANKSNQKSPASAGEHSCKSCNRGFKSENALQSHNQAKHK